MGTAERDVSRKKKQQQRGGEVGVRALLRPLSLFSSLFFSRSLPSRHTPLSERLEQPINSRTYCKKTDLQSLFRGPNDLFFTVLRSIKRKL